MDQHLHHHHRRSVRVSKQAKQGLHTTRSKQWPRHTRMQLLRACTAAHLRQAPPSLSLGSFLPPWQRPILMGCGGRQGVCQVCEAASYSRSVATILCPPDPQPQLITTPICAIILSLRNPSSLIIYFSQLFIYFLSPHLRSCRRVTSTRSRGRRREHAAAAICSCSSSLTCNAIRHLDTAHTLSV